MTEFAGGLVAVAARLTVLAGIDLRHAGLRIGGSAGLCGWRRPLCRPAARPVFGAALRRERRRRPAAPRALGFRRGGFGGGGGGGGGRVAARPRATAAGGAVIGQRRARSTESASVFTRARRLVRWIAVLGRWRRRRPWIRAGAGGPGVAPCPCCPRRPWLVARWSWRYPWPRRCPVRLAVSGPAWSSVPASSLRRVGAVGALGRAPAGGAGVGGRGGAVQQIGEWAWPAPAHPAPDGCGRWANGGGSGRIGRGSDATLGTEDLTLRDGNALLFAIGGPAAWPKIIDLYQWLSEEWVAPRLARRPARIAGPGAVRERRRRRALCIAPPQSAPIVMAVALIPGIEGARRQPRPECSIASTSKAARRTPASSSPCPAASIRR